jgi:hypothetical protein
VAGGVGDPPDAAVFVADDLSHEPSLRHDSDEPSVRVELLNLIGGRVPEESPRKCDGAVVRPHGEAGHATRRLGTGGDKPGLILPPPLRDPEGWVVLEAPGVCLRLAGEVRDTTRPERGGRRRDGDRQNLG